MTISKKQNMNIYILEKIEKNFSDWLEFFGKKCYTIIGRSTNSKKMNNQIALDGHSKNKYKFGDCIPISDIIYFRLKEAGYNPKIVIGWIEVFEGDILPDKNFIRLFKDEIALVLPHTWIEVNNHRIDLTKNQFDIYGGVYKYYPAYIDVIINKNYHKIEKYNSIKSKIKKTFDLLNFSMLKISIC